MAVASSGALESTPAVAMELSVCRVLEAPGAGPLIYSAWTGVSLWSLALLISSCPGGGQILRCVPGAQCSLACAV